jgi:hypothetical protein
MSSRHASRASRLGPMAYGAKMCYFGVVSHYFNPRGPKYNLDIQGYNVNIFLKKELKIK